MHIGKVVSSRTRIHALELRSATCFLTLIPPMPTWFHVDLRGTIPLSPPQQQLENNPNQKSKKLRTQKMGWDNFSNTHPHKEKNEITNNTCIKKLSILLPENSKKKYHCQIRRGLIET
jgi:hypothetical protein